MHLRTCSVILCLYLTLCCQMPAKSSNSSESAPKQKLSARAGSPPENSPASLDKSEQALSSTKDAPESRKVEILFGGSLCPVCLVAFQRRLASTQGVLNAQVEALAEKHKSGHPPRRAHAIVEYSPDKISQAELTTIVRQNDFQFLKASDISGTNR